MYPVCGSPKTSKITQRMKTRNNEGEDPTKPYIAPISPEYIGLLTRGTAYAIMTRAPENIPADPTPATARPMIKATEVGAAPQMTTMMLSTRMKMSK